MNTPKTKKVKVPKPSDLQNGYNKYAFIMDNLHKCDITSDDKLAKEFRTRFKGFFRVIGNSQFVWESIFSFLQENKKNTKISYEKTIKQLFKETNTRQKFMSGVIVSVINPERPPYNKSVLLKLNLKPSSTSSGIVMEEANEHYLKTEKWFNDQLNSSTGKQMIQDFDAQIKNSGIQAIKKIDLILWAKNKKEQKELKELKKLQEKK